MAEKSYTYLDYAASAPLRPCAMEAWVGYHEKPHAVANANSLHTLGRSAARDLEAAHRTLARCIGCGFRPNEIILTSGGTESNNLAVLGMAEGARRKSANRRNRVILSAIEHDSVLDVASILRSRGFEVVLAKPGRDGVVSAEEVRASADDATALVSVMAANNETGVVQPTAKVIEAAHSAGALAHVDAVQAFGRIDLDCSGADAISVGRPQRSEALWAWVPWPCARAAPSRHRPSAAARRWAEGRNPGRCRSRGVRSGGRAGLPRAALSKAPGGGPREPRLRAPLRRGYGNRPHHGGARGPDATPRNGERHGPQHGLRVARAQA